MAFKVPETLHSDLPVEVASAAQAILDAIVEFTGATGGWVARTGPVGSLSIIFQSGMVSTGWLAAQQGRTPGWGFVLGDGTSLLNNLPQMPALGEPLLRHLLACPIFMDGVPAGHLVLTNKPQGFTARDTSAAEAVAHLMGKCLTAARDAPASLPASLLHSALDRTGVGILAVDASGTLLFANAVMAKWTGYTAADLRHRPPPYPFWVSLPDLTQHPWPLALASGGRSTSYLPFRQRNHEIFWCQVQAFLETVAGQAVTIATLRRIPELPRVGTTAAPGEAESLISFQAMAESLPIAAALIDSNGRVAWANPCFYHEIRAAPDILGRPLREILSPASAGALEQLVRERGAVAEAHRGRLFLELTEGQGQTRELVCCWQRVPLGEGAGVLLGFAEDWETLWPPDDLVAAWRRPAARSASNWRALLLRPGQPIAFWDGRWEQLTGLDARDVQGVPGELLLDWLFPRQRDRDFVADLLHRPTPRGAQAILELAGPAGSRPLLWTVLPVTADVKDVPSPEGPRAVPGSSKAWLLLASEPQVSTGEDPSVPGLLSPFARGLSHLLNHYLTVPLGLAEMALERADLPAEIVSWFGQILDSCTRVSRLLASLEALALTHPGDMTRLSLARLVEEFLTEHAAQSPPDRYEIDVQLVDTAAEVCGNPRLLKTVLRHLFTNAEQALLNRDHRRIGVRVLARDGDVACEIRDSGEGLPTPDWLTVLAPFYSTKGPFARDTAHAAMEAVGLGLTVSQHLLALHGGRLELRSTPGEGTTATIVLPQAQPMAAETARAPQRAEGAAAQHLPESPFSS
jgi:signal transduction histidine kinase